jgi:4-amino-4-deoxy-L-arabinose transferase-like glycosyltransferase
MKLFLKKNWPLLSILFAAFFLRFVGISWGLPYYFHPDEWNMANAVAQLSWLDKLHPHFFAYGQLPLYLAYFSARLYNLLPWIGLAKIDLSEAIFFLRFWSALAGIGTVYLVYLITKRFLTANYCLLATLLAAFTPGLIQIAHFGTTESLLSFFFLAILYFSLGILEKPDWKNYLGAAAFLGLALGTKISATTFSAPFLFATALTLLRQKTVKEKSKILVFLVLSLTLTLTLALAVSPYLVLDFPESKRILLYETQVATSQIPVFYTRQFLKTAPVLFQFQKIFPYTLGWPIFILGVLGFLLALSSSVKNLLKKRFSLLNTYYLILTAFLVYFLSQAFLFCKWTRFMAPVFAFFPIFAAFFLQRISSLIKNQKGLTTIYLLLTTFLVIPGLFFSTIYFHPDIRFTASEWIIKNLPSGARALSEGGNVIDLPIQPADPHRLSITDFDFYQLDENPQLFPRLLDSLSGSDFIIVPSRRLFANHLRLPEQYPLAAKYYGLLFSGKLGFEPIKTFFPLGPSLLNDETAEETWSVFDHPVIRVFQKKVSLTRQEYEELFKEN